MSHPVAETRIRRWLFAPCGRRQVFQIPARRLCFLIDLGAGDPDRDRLGSADVGGEIRRREAVGRVAVKRRRGAEPQARQIMRTAGDRQEGGGGNRGQQRGPRGQFVGMVGDDEGAEREHPVVPNGRFRPVPDRSAREGRNLRQQVRVRVMSRGLPFEQGLRDEDQLLEVILHRRFERGPRLSPSGVEAPPGIALADEDIHEDPVPAPNVDEARERPGSTVVADVGVSGIHILPQLDEKGGDAEILKHMFARFRLLHPVVPQPVRMPIFQFGVGILHALLGDQLVVTHPLGVARQRTLSVSMDDGEQMGCGPHESFRQRERLRRK